MMMLPIEEDIDILQGVTWNPVLRWFSADAVHKIISNVQVGLPTLVTVTAHGLTGTAPIPVWITNVKGPRDFNTDDYRCAQPRWATVVDADTLAIEFDSGSMGAYQSGGVLTYYPAVDLTGYSATETLLSAPGEATPLLQLTSATNGGITLGADGTITRLVTPAQSTALGQVNGYHKLELTDPDGVVTRIAEGGVRVALTAQA